MRKTAKAFTEEDRAAEVQVALATLVRLNVLPESAVKALEVVAKKNQDYNSLISRDAYFPMGLPSYAQMLHVKCLRLVNLSMSRETPNAESIEDTSIDLFNYCCFLLEYLDKRPKNEELS